MQSNLIYMLPLKTNINIPHAHQHFNTHYSAITSHISLYPPLHQIIHQTPTLLHPTLLHNTPTQTPITTPLPSIQLFSQNLLRSRYSHSSNHLWSSQLLFNPYELFGQYLCDY